MSGGRTNIKPTEYRNGQNAIRDGRTKVIVYMFLEAKDTTILILIFIHAVKCILINALKRKNTYDGG